jgi:hypothetical protein
MLSSKDAVKSQTWLHGESDKSRFDSPQAAPDHQSMIVESSLIL